MTFNVCMDISDEEGDLRAGMVGCPHCAARGIVGALRSDLLKPHVAAVFLEQLGEAQTEAPPGPARPTPKRRHH